MKVKPMMCFATQKALHKSLKLLFAVVCWGNVIETPVKKEKGIPPPPRCGPYTDWVPVAAISPRTEVLLDTNGSFLLRASSSCRGRGEGLGSGPWWGQMVTFPSPKLHPPPLTHTPTHVFTNKRNTPTPALIPHAAVPKQLLLYPVGSFCMSMPPQAKRTFVLLLHGKAQ